MTSALLKQGMLWFLLLTIVVVSSCTVPTGLDLKLMKAVTTDLGKNEAISPFVMSTLMTQVWLGARGTTRNEMTPVLGLTTPTPNSFLSAYQAAIDHLISGTSNVSTAVFNNIYVKSGFSIKPTFTSTLTTYYRAGVKTFTSEAQAASDINSAVANVTNNLIKELVTAEALKDAKLVLVSALYFNGLWLDSFNSTMPGTFLTNTGETTVPMMKLLTKSIPYVYKSGEFDAISLQYQDEDYSMVLLRPLSRSMSAVQALRDSLDSLDVASIVSQMHPTRTDVRMPRFEIKAEYKDLEQTFPTLGIQTLFTDQADLGNMAYQPLKVNKIILKVFMNVTEEGTEAAGAGGVVIGPTSLPTQFVLDRPFFAIVWNEKYKITLFIAYVASP